MIYCVREENIEALGSKSSTNCSEAGREAAFALVKAGGGAAFAIDEGVEEPTVFPGNGGAFNRVNITNHLSICGAPKANVNRTSRPARGRCSRWQGTEALRLPPHDQRPGGAIGPAMDITAPGHRRTGRLRPSPVCGERIRTAG
jgi:hypothetical protein